VLITLSAVAQVLVFCALWFVTVPVQCVGRMRASAVKYFQFQEFGSKTVHQRPSGLLNSFVENILIITCNWCFKINVDISTHQSASR
jgi:hypothetical protein